MRRISIIVATGAMTLGSAVVAQVAPREPQISAERSAYARAQSQSSDATRRANLLQGQAERAGTEAARARRTAAAVAARVQAYEAQIAAGQARLALARRQLDQSQVRLAERQQPVVRLTAALQALARKPAIALLAQPGSLSEIIHVRALLTSILPEIRRRTARLRAELARMRKLRDDASGTLAALDRSRDRLAIERTRLARVAGASRVRSAGLSRIASVENERALALGEEARDLGDLVASLETSAGVRASLASLSGPILRPSDPARPVPARLAAPGSMPAKAIQARRRAYRLPVVGTVVTGFGEVSDGGFRSRGLTIATLPGAQAIAPADGRIAYAGAYRGYGRILVIEHRDGWTTLLTDLDTLSVGVGTDVRQGDPVGRSGPRKPRVTVELRRNGTPADIAALLN